MIGVFDKLLGHSSKGGGGESPLTEHPSELVTNFTENSDVGAIMPAQPPPDTPPSICNSIAVSSDSHEHDDFRTSFSDTSESHSLTVQRVPASLQTPATHLPTCEARLSLLRENQRNEGSDGGERDLRLLDAVRSNNVALTSQILHPEPDVDGPNPNVTDSWGRAPLHLAAEHGSLDLVLLLIDYGDQIDVNMRDMRGRTPLHEAADRGFTEVAKFLMRCGADVNIQDNDGNTPLHYASRGDFDELLLCFLRRGPNLVLRNQEGFTPRQLAGPRCTSLLKDAEAKRKKTVPHQTPSGAPKPVARIQIPEYSQDDVNVLMGCSSPRAHLPPVSPSLKRTGPEDFDLVQQLGKGSFGDVYLVKRKSDSSHFAMKVLKKDKIMNQNLVKYAMTERNVLSYVRHPFIVGLNAAFQTAEKLFLILDYCPGGDMGWHLAKEKRFNETRARIYAGEVLLALEELHKRDIIYRDLKPDNVVFDSEGHAMLTDFGLSREGVYDNFSAKSFCGSIAYLAPEMLKRQGHGKAVDWYLLGVLVYEMLVGTPPYFSRNREQLFQNIQNAQLNLPPGMSLEAKNLIRSVRFTQLLERDPSRRLGSSAKGPDDVKAHPFFHSVNWDLAVKRELRPPVLPRPCIACPSPLTKERVYGAEGQLGHHFEGWTFVSQ